MNRQLGIPEPTENQSFVKALAGGLLSKAKSSAEGSRAAKSGTTSGASSLPMPSTRF